MTQPAVIGFEVQILHFFVGLPTFSCGIPTPIVYWKTQISILLCDTTWLLKLQVPFRRHEKWQKGIPAVGEAFFVFLHGPFIAAEST